MMSRRPPKAPTGMPPPMILPSVVKSGRTPYSVCAPPKATRKPVMTSSNISSAPARSHSRLSVCKNCGAGADEAHRFEAGHECDPPPREPRLQFGGRAEAQAVSGDLLHGFDDQRMRVPEDHWAPGTDEIDVAPIIRREHMGALGFFEE